MIKYQIKDQIVPNISHQKNGIKWEVLLLKFEVEFQWSSIVEISLDFVNLIVIYQLQTIINCEKLISTITELLCCKGVVTMKTKKKKL